MQLTTIPIISFKAISNKYLLGKKKTNQKTAIVLKLKLNFINFTLQFLN